VSDFVTVFEIARGSHSVFAEQVFRLLVGIAALIGGVTARSLSGETFMRAFTSTMAKFFV
jgi:hypothetical protein